MALAVTKEEALALVDETAEQLTRAVKSNQSLAEANRRMREQLTHVPSLPSMVTGTISVTTAAATSYADGYMTDPNAKEEEEEVAVSVGMAALSTGIAVASSPGKIKDTAIAAAEGAASGIAARQAFKEGRKARIKVEAARAREAAKKA